jgi:signal peptidase I
MEFFQLYLGLDFTEKLLYGAAFVCTLTWLIAFLLRIDKKNLLREYAEAGTVAVWLALAIRFSLVEAYSIPSESMVPTLEINDHLLVNKLIYGYHLPFHKGRILDWRKPHRGEIVIFIPPSNPLQSYVKRCVGLPGDVLEVRDKHIFINGKPGDWPQANYVIPALPENQNDMRLYSPASPGWPESITIPANTYWASEGPMALGAPTGKPWNRDWYGPVTVPAHCYWMMGDNRDFSSDSRYWGPVPEENLRGTPLFRYWPITRLGIPR